MITDLKAEEARHAAQVHFQVDSGLIDAYRLVAPGEREAEPTEPVKLLEVNRETVELGLCPVYFSADPRNGARYSLVVIEVTPNEFTEDLPAQIEREFGWTLGERIELPKRNGAHAQ